MSEPSLAPTPSPSYLVLDHRFPPAPSSYPTTANRNVQLPPAFTRYSLFAALSGLMGEGLAPYLPQITTLMLLSLRSTEGIVVSRVGGLGRLGKVSPGVRLISWAQLS